MNLHELHGSEVDIPTFGSLRSGMVFRERAGTTKYVKVDAPRTWALPDSYAMDLSTNMIVDFPAAAQVVILKHQLRIWE